MNTVPVWATTLMVGVFTPIAVGTMGFPSPKPERRRLALHALFGWVVLPIVCGMTAAYFGWGGAHRVPVTCTAALGAVRCPGDHPHNVRKPPLDTRAFAKPTDERTPRRGHVEE